MKNTVVYGLLFSIALVVSSPLASANNESQFIKKIRTIKNYRARKLIKRLLTTSNAKRKLLESFYHSAGGGVSLVAAAPFRLQTGPYKRIALSDQMFRTKCLKEIVWSANQLNKAFPKVSFEIDGRIKNCKNLKAGVQAILDNANRVNQNVSRFITPMHTVFLTNFTKFNHQGIGKMGLYIDVNKKNEINKRLVEFRVGVNDIEHERMTKKL